MVCVPLKQYWISFGVIGQVLSIPHSFEIVVRNDELKEWIPDTSFDTKVCRFGAVLDKRLCVNERRPIPHSFGTVGNDRFKG